MLSRVNASPREFRGKPVNGIYTIENMARVQVDVEGGVRKHTERFGLDEKLTDSTRGSAYNELSRAKTEPCVREEGLYIGWDQCFRGIELYTLY